VYRIPDAPLTARFLAFYSFSQLLEILNEAVATAQADLAAPCRLAGLPVPVVGLKWYNFLGERWLELLVPASLTGDSGRGKGNSSTSSSSSSGNGRDGALAAAGADGCSDGSSSEEAPVLVRMHPSRLKEWQGRLEELQVTAARLSKGAGLRLQTPQGPKELRLWHSDFQFFNSRS
jgi:hypothetical protein